MAVLHLYLGESGRAAVLAGQARITTRVKAAVEAAGWQVVLCADEERSEIPGREGYHLVVNHPVPSDNCLTLRRVGWEPFWRIERTNDRWDWQAAGETFDPETIEAKKGQQFVKHWGPKLFDGQTPGAGGGVFVPLQGKLTEKRHFQAVSPLDMVRAVARRWTKRRISLTLHPGEDYAPDEMEALGRLVEQTPNVRLATGGSDAELLGCDLVVTQNSSMALKGFVAGKPALLWARIDFHHIAGSVPRDGREAAFKAAEAAMAGTAGTPEFGRYLVWYLKMRCLRSWDTQVEPAICARLRDLGWPI